MVKVKVAFGEDIRHWHYPTTNRYQDLVSFVEKTLKFDPLKKKEYYFQFEDAEMDKITIGNEQDLLDAFECAEQEKRPSLKIFVIQGSINDTHEGPAREEEEEAVVEPQEAVVVENNEQGATESKVECEERNWCEVALEFLLNEKVHVLLPELVRRVAVVLREEAKNGKEASLVEVVPRVLEEATFEPIVGHELYQKHLKQLLPELLMQGSCFTHILLSLNEAALSVWMEDVMKLVIMSLGSEDHGLWNMHMDAWRQHANNEEAVHYGVKCDGCGVIPIRGARYKCAVCQDYDLCEKCESSKVHYNGHPLVKMARPMCRRHFGLNHFQGLGEITGKRCRRRGGGEHSPEFPFSFGRCHGRRWNTPCWMKYACKNQSFMCDKKEKKWERKCEKQCDKETKKKCKLENRKEKLLRKLNKVNSKLNGQEEMKMEPEEAMHSSLKILCICGVPLVQTTAMEAYRRCAQVICDKCNKSCSTDEVVFHCPVKRSPQHRGGYDVCWNCATNEVIISSEPKPEVQVEEPKVEQPKVEQPKVEEPKVEQPKVEELLEPEPVDAVDPFVNFSYATEARCLVDMGFHDYARIASLLLSKNGNIEQVLAELLSQ